MPESTCLHIQDRESGPIRVVELPWISVRIGRAAYCEVRLPDAEVAEEACRLTRRGRTWSLVPSPNNNRIVLEGRPLQGPCPLPFDVPFRMGPYCLTLRHDLEAEPDWELYPALAPATSVEPTPEVVPSPASHFATELGAAVDGRTASANRSEMASKPALDPDRWRARWKAAEAHYKARANRLDTGGPRNTPSASPDSLRDSHRTISRSPSSDPTPAGPSTRPIPRPSAHRIESSWNATAPIPPTANPRLVPKPGRVPTVADTPTETAPTDSLGLGATDATLVMPDVATEHPADSPVEEWRSEFTAEIAIPASEPPVDVQPESTETVPLEGSPVALELINPESLAPEQPVSTSHPTTDEVPTVELESAAPVSQPEPRPTRAPDRIPRKRRARDRMNGGPGIETPGETRQVRRFSEPSARAGGEAPPGPETVLPSVHDILTNHRNCAGPCPAVERPRRVAQAVPTISQAPGQWTLPGLLVLPPVGIVTLMMGLLTCLLSWCWINDASTAAVLTQRLFAAEGAGRRKPLPAGIVPPGGRWIKTNAQHLANWAVYTASVDNDPTRPPHEVSSLSSRALEISPLNPTARLAQAQLAGPGGDGPGWTRVLGLSRDSVSLAWSARRLMVAGKKEAALRLYHRAISAVVDGGPSRSAAPRFADDPMVRRYLLPGEDSARDIVAELASNKDLEFREWSRALPHNPTVLLATARLLREQERTEADSLLDELLGDNWGDAGAVHGDPRLMAARAEALGLRSRWKDAAELYRQAIERVDNDLVRRSWWFNLADIAQRLNDEGQRQSAFRAVLASDGSDDIARRVSQIQRASEARVRTRDGYGSVKAN